MRAVRRAPRRTSMDRTSGKRPAMAALFNDSTASNGLDNLPI